MKMHGNMTEVEKHMNKDDLIAWKNYDNNQYSLIPGVSNEKKTLDRAALGYQTKTQQGSVSNLGVKGPLVNNDRMQER